MLNFVKFRIFFEWRVARYNPQFQLNRQSELYLSAERQTLERSNILDLDEHENDALRNACLLVQVGGRHGPVSSG